MSAMWGHGEGISIVLTLGVTISATIASSSVSGGSRVNPASRDIGLRPPLIASHGKHGSNSSLKSKIGSKENRRPEGKSR